MLKLPKGISSHPKVAEIELLFSIELQTLRPDGQLTIPKWKSSERLQKAMHVVALSGKFVQGLETAEKTLRRELQGLETLAAKTGQAHGQRLSRFLLLSNDGSERFYHDAESLIRRHAGRLFACLLDLNAEDLGSILLPPEKSAKALMIDDRKALENFLIALVE